MKRLLFIINPCSGKGRIRNKLLSVLDIFAKRGYRVETYVTQEALDARRKGGTRGRRGGLLGCSGGGGGRTVGGGGSGLRGTGRSYRRITWPAGCRNGRK